MDERLINIPLLRMSLFKTKRDAVNKCEQSNVLNQLTNSVDRSGTKHEVKVEALYVSLNQNLHPGLGGHLSGRVNNLAMHAGITASETASSFQISPYGSLFYVL